MGLGCYPDPGPETQIREISDGKIVITLGKFSRCLTTKEAEALMIGLLGFFSKTDSGCFSKRRFSKMPKAAKKKATKKSAKKATTKAKNAGSKSSKKVSKPSKKTAAKSAEITQKPDSDGQETGF
jgi:uncharacterized protein YdaU (DUF1376 family)